MKWYKKGFEGCLSASIFVPKWHKYFGEVMTPAELEKKFYETYSPSPNNYPGLDSAISEALDKMDMSKLPIKDILTENVMEDVEVYVNKYGVPVIICQVGGDEYMPIALALYYYQGGFRIYVPEYGNTYNPLILTAFYKYHNEDLIPSFGFTDEQVAREADGIEPNIDLIKKDIDIAIVNEGYDRRKLSPTRIKLEMDYASEINKDNDEDDENEEESTCPGCDSCNAPEPEPIPDPDLDNIKILLAEPGRFPELITLLGNPDLHRVVIGLEIDNSSFRTPSEILWAKVLEDVDVDLARNLILFDNPIPGTWVAETAIKMGLTDIVRVIIPAGITEKISLQEKWEIEAMLKKFSSEEEKNLMKGAFSSEELRKKRERSN